VLLSGQTALSLASLASTIGSILGRPALALRTASADEYVARNASADPDADFRQTAPFLRAWAKTYDGLRRGEAAGVDPLIAELLGRPPKSMERYLREALVGGGGGRDAIEQYAK
jgi:hypothetical protein